MQIRPIASPVRFSALNPSLQARVEAMSDLHGEGIVFPQMLKRLESLDAERQALQQQNQTVPQALLDRLAGVEHFLAYILENGSHSSRIQSLRNSSYVITPESRLGQAFLTAVAKQFMPGP